MQTTISRDLLSAMLERATASPFAATRTTMPILQHVLLEATTEEFKATAYNLDNAITLSTPCPTIITGSIAVPGVLLKDLLRYMPADQPITLTVDEKTMRLTMRAGSTRHVLNGMDPAEYPTPPTPDEKTQTTITTPATALLKTLKNVSHAISTDVSRQVLTCLKTTIKDGALHFAATDGYRLATRQLAVETGNANLTVLPPKLAIQALTTVLENAGAKSDVTLTFAGEEPKFFASTTNDAMQISTMIFMNMTAYVFPDYKAIIPKAYTYGITVSTTDLIRALNAAKLYARDNANIVRFTITPPTGDLGATLGSLTVTATSAVMGASEEALDAEVETTPDDKPFEASFNATYLLETLRTISTSKVKLEFTTPTRPCAVTAFPNLCDEDLDVLMPMHPPH